LKKALAKSKATWKIVVGHHQIVTSDCSSNFIMKTLQPLFRKYKVCTSLFSFVINIRSELVYL